MIYTRDNVFGDYRRWINDGGMYTREVLARLIKSMRADAGNTKSYGGGRWRPSLIGDPCDRKQMLSFLGEPSTFHGNWYTWEGTWMHLAFQTYLMDSYQDRVAIEYQIKPKRRHLGVTGKADWVWLGDSLQDGMLTIKGPHIGDYKTVATLNKVGIAPKPEHVEQLGYEMMTIGVAVGYLVYQNRTHGDIVTWRLSPEPGDYVAMQRRLAELGTAARAGQLPPMLEGCLAQSGAVYRECNFKDSCLAHALKGSPEKEDHPSWE